MKRLVYKSKGSTYDRFKGKTNYSILFTIIREGVYTEVSYIKLILNYLRMATHIFIQNAKILYSLLTLSHTQKLYVVCNIWRTGIFPLRQSYPDDVLLQSSICAVTVENAFHKNNDSILNYCPQLASSLRTLKRQINTNTMTLLPPSGQYFKSISENISYLLQPPLNNTKSIKDTALLHEKKTVY